MYVYIFDATCCESGAEHDSCIFITVCVFFGVVFFSGWSERMILRDGQQFIHPFILQFSV